MSNQDTLITRRASLLGMLGKVDDVIYITDVPATGYQTAVPPAFNDQLSGSDRERLDPAP